MTWRIGLVVIVLCWWHGLLDISVLDYHVLSSIWGNVLGNCVVLSWAELQSLQALELRAFLFWIRCRYFWFLRGVLLTCALLIVLYWEAELSVYVHSASSKTSAPPLPSSIFKVCRRRKGDRVCVCLFYPRNNNKEFALSLRSQLLTQSVSHWLNYIQ